MEELSGRIPFIVDGGATEHGIESTVIAARDGGIEVLRSGPIAQEELAAFAEVRMRASDRTESPGQLPSHYRPQTPLAITEEISKIAVPQGKRYGALLWSDAPFSETFVESRRLSTTGNLREAATNLFRQLRELDHARLDCIVAEALPEEGLGVAIMDRLRRAAHAGVRRSAGGHREVGTSGIVSNFPSASPRSRRAIQAVAFLALVREAGANKSAEKRVRFVRLALEFRVVLAGEEKRMVRAARSIPRARRRARCR